MLSGSGPELEHTIIKRVIRGYRKVLEQIIKQLSEVLFNIELGVVTDTGNEDIRANLLTTQAMEVIVASQKFEKYVGGYDNHSFHRIEWVYVRA